MSAPAPPKLTRGGRPITGPEAAQAARSGCVARAATVGALVQDALSSDAS